MAQAADNVEAANLLLRVASEELQRARTHNLLLLNDVVESLWRSCAICKDAAQT